MRDLDSSEVVDIAQDFCRRYEVAFSDLSPRQDWRGRWRVRVSGSDTIDFEICTIMPFVRCVKFPVRGNKTFFSVIKKIFWSSIKRDEALQMALEIAKRFQIQATNPHVIRELSCWKVFMSHARHSQSIKIDRESGELVDIHFGAPR